jgi:hypothetical protein
LFIVFARIIRSFIFMSVLPLDGLSDLLKECFLHDCIAHGAYAHAAIVLCNMSELPDRHLYIFLDAMKNMDCHSEEMDIRDEKTKPPGLPGKFTGAEDLAIAMMHMYHERQLQHNVDDIHVDVIVLRFVRKEKWPKGYEGYFTKRIQFPQRFAAEYIRLGGNPEYMIDPDSELEDAVMQGSNEVKAVLDKYPNYTFPWFLPPWKGFRYEGSKYKTLIDRLSDIIPLLQQRRAMNGQVWNDKVFVQVLLVGDTLHVAWQMITTAKRLEPGFDPLAILRVRLCWAAAKNNVAVIQSTESRFMYEYVSELVTLACLYDSMDAFIYLMGLDLGQCQGMLDFDQNLGYAINNENVEMAREICDLMDFDDVVSQLDMGLDPNTPNSTCDCNQSITCAVVASRLDPSTVPSRLSDRWFTNPNITFALSKKWRVPEKMLRSYYFSRHRIAQHIPFVLATIAVEYVS